jgi:hypothetical protein
MAGRAIAAPGPADVNAVLLLVGLLVLSYLGSFLLTGRASRGAGLPSGVEYVALGFVLGPRVLDLVGGDMLASFEPVVQVALGWLAFAVGLDFGYAGEKRVRVGSLLLGTLGALVTGGAVAAAVWFTLRGLHLGGRVRDQILLAGGVGTACSETTRHAVRWVLERQNARGPLAERLNEIAHADDLRPLLAVAVLFALAPTPTVTVPLPLRDWPTITVGIGLLIGAGASLLVRSELKLDETWAVLFGVALLAIGATARLALSTLTASFFLGLAMAAMTSPKLWIVAAAAIGARLVAKVVLGWILALFLPAARKAGGLVGLSLMSSGALAISVGLAFALRFPGPVGDTVLVVAAVSALVGEFMGPLRLRRSLQDAGEIEAASSNDPEGARARAEEGAT